MLLQELIDEYILLFRRGELTSSQQRELIDWLNADATHRPTTERCSNYMHALK